MNKFVVVKLYNSLFKDAQGKFHIEETLVECNHPVAYYIPSYLHNVGTYIIVNGRFIEPTEYNTYIIKDNAEMHIKVIPGYGAGFTIGALLVQIAISLVISLAISAIMYFAFPPKKPQIKTPREDNAYSWEGITTTQGPGNVVPVSYGTVKLGGQLLMAFFTQQPTAGGHGGIALQHAKPYLSVLLGLGEGEIDFVEVASVTVNNQPLTNYPDVSVTYSIGGDPNDMTFGEIQNTFDAGNLEITTSGVTYTTNDDVHAVILDVQFLEGIFHIDDGGGNSPNTVTFQYRTRVSPAGAWSAFTDVTITAEVFATAFKPVRIEFGTLDTYDIEIVFVTARKMSVSRSKWKPFLHAVTEILYEEQSFPNTALLNARTVATENLQGALPNFQVIIRGLKVRIGSFGATPAYSDNPAWCLMDFMTNTRYGAAIADADINLASFIAFANYCDELVNIDTDGDEIADATEKRALMSFTLDADKQAIDAFEELLSGTRGVLVKSEGQWKVKIARDDTPVQLITWANTIRDSVVIRYIRDIDDINVVEGRFLNETDNFENDVETYPVFDDWPSTINKLSVEYRGVSRNTQVLRELYFELQSRTKPKFTVEFAIPIEGIVFEVMDIINFTYPTFQETCSGRIASAYGIEVNSVRQFIIDEDFTFEVGQSYIGVLKYPNDTLQEVILNNPATVTPVTTRVIELDTLDPDLTQVPTALETIFAIGNSTEVLTYPVRITEISKESDFTIKVQGVHHVSAIYDEYVAFDDGNREISNPFQASTRPPPLLTLQAHELVFFDSNETGLTGDVAFTDMLLEWTVADINSNPNETYAPYGGVIIYYAYVDTASFLGSFALGTTFLAGFDEFGSELVTLATINDATAFSFKDHAYKRGGSTLYVVVPISQQGVPNNEGSVNVVAVGGGGLFMPPDNFLATGISTTAIELTWQDTLDPRFDSVNLYIGGPTFNDATFITNVPLGTETYTHGGLVALTTYTFWATSVRINGTEGQAINADGTTL